MKLLMVGTPVCTKCKRIAPQVEEMCESQNIQYEYMNFQDLPKDMLDLLAKAKIMSAPVFFLFDGDSPIRLIEGDNIIKVLSSIA